MKKKFSTIWRAMLALVLIASLGVVFSAAPAGAVNGLAVNITDPTSTPDVFVGELFAVTANVDNTGSDTAQNVTMTISWDGDAELVPSGASPTINVGDIPTYWDRVETVNWTLKCTGPEDLTIYVRADADNRSWVEDKEYVNQLFQEELTVTIDPPAEPEICECTDFDVVATVENTGDFTIEDIDVTLEIDGDASLVSGPLTQNIGDLAKGADKGVTWTLHCDAGATGNCPAHNYVDIDVTAVGDGPISGVDGVTASDPRDNYVDQKYLMLEITVPESSTPYCIGDEFWVDARIKNRFDEDVEGTLRIILDPTSGAVVEDPGMVQENVTIPKNDEINLSDLGGPVEWHLRCDEGGDLNIKVHFLGIADSTTLCDEDTITVHQKDPADLEVELTAPSCVGYCQDFDVTATVTNTGGPNAATATGVTADLDLISGDVDGTMNDIAVADIPAGESMQVSWTLHCNGLEDAEFLVTVTGTGPCGPDLEATDTVDVTQVYLTVDIVAFPNPPYRPSQEFDVTATLTNSDDVPITVGNVVIDPGATANLNSDDTASKDVGLIPVDESQEISWTLHCNSPGTSTITVTANVTEPCAVTIDNDITVSQEYPPTTLEVEILSPDTGSKYATSQEFAVTAVVTNTGDQPAVVAGVGIFGNGFDVIGTPDEDVELGTMEPGDSEMVTWTLHCDESGLTFIMLNASAINLSEGQDYCDLYDSVIVWQYPAAHLEVQILDDVTPDEVVTCTTYDVTAIIHNTGEADATEVYATLSVNPDGSVRVSADDPEGTYTKYVGTIPGHDSEDNYKLVTWNLHCKVACDSEITVTAEGYDEYGWHIKQESQSTGNFIIEYGALVSEQLDNPYFSDGGLPPPNRGWSYGLFAGDASGLAPGPFIVDTDLSMARWGGGPDYLGHIVGMGFVIPHMEYTGYFEDLIDQACQYNPDGLDLEGKDFMFWVVHIEMDSPYDMIGPWSEWCVGPGLIEVINGTIAGTYYKWNDPLGDYQDSLLGGTFHSNMAAEAGRPIPERFIEPDGVTVKQLPLSVDLALTKEVVGDDTVTVGETATFTVTVENLGPSDATGIFVYDLLPAGLNFTGLTLSQGWYYVGEGQWSVGDLAFGETATLTLTATVNTVGEIYNAAVVGYLDQHDPITTNDVGVAMVTGEAPEAVTQATIELNVGYNLISLPLIPDTPDIEAMTSAIDFLVVAMYDASVPNWFVYAGGTPTPPFETMDDGYGYWINMDTAGPPHLTFNGQELVADPLSLPPSYDVVEGWNLIGFKSTTPKPAAEYLDGIAGKYVMIYGYDDGFFIAGSPGHEYLQPGLGYWLALKTGESGTIYP